MEDRKRIEKEYHNLKRDEIIETIEKSHYVSGQMKWYTIVRQSTDAYQKWLSERCEGKIVLDYGSGNGQMSINMAKIGASKVFGIDISDVSIDNAKQVSLREGFDQKIEFQVMDAEQTSFKDNFFDIGFESGVLHHLDLPKAYTEIARILKPTGQMICTEALGHNPLIHYYRKRTPNLRTAWEVEHILRKKDIELAKKYFNRVEFLGFYHLAAIAAVPFRNTSGFNFMLGSLEAVDNIILKLPVLKWQAWQVIFILSEPKK